MRVAQCSYTMNLDLMIPHVWILYQKYLSQIVLENETQCIEQKL